MIVPLSILGDVSCSKTRKHAFSKLADLQAYCFPQKDDRHRRVFFGAKLSTTVLCGRRANVSKSKGAITAHIYPGNNFQETCKTVSYAVPDLAAIDAKNVPVPLVDASEWAILKAVHTREKVVPLRNVEGIGIRRGEINQSIYRKYITENSQYARLVKGVEIGPYCLHVKLSQGKQEWLNEKTFLKKHKVRVVAKCRRIATQRITGIDERVRIVATIIDPLAYFADSTNSITLSKNSVYSLEYLLGLLNSEFYQWRFRATSTNNNVGTNELDVMPFRVLDFQVRSDKKMFEGISEAATELLRLSKMLDTGSPDDRRRYATLLSRKRTEIDTAVEKLFGLDSLKAQPWKVWNPPPRRRRRSNAT
jgi:hypothetical protein